MEDGIAAFEAREYVRAETEFRRLVAAYPDSATARAWLADVILFDRGRDERKAALESRPYYEEAFAMHDQGCVLPRRARYYALMGDAYGALRLARGEGGFVESELERAERTLLRAEAEFPGSAEVPYNLARVLCARARQGAPGAFVERCLSELGRAFETAETLERPRFLRTHRSTQDWIVRSRSQSEFVELRKLPEYGALVKRVLAAQR